MLLHGRVVYSNVFRNCSTGLPSMTAINEGIQFCIFDLRRGQNEGQEIDKILFFYPSDCPFPMQLSVIGLCEGIITFTRIFSPQAPCEVIEAERHSHVFYEAESDIWMVMVVDKNKDTESIWRCDALRGILKEVHSLFTMFHGSLRALLEKQPSGELARNHLYSFITDYLTGMRNFCLPYKIVMYGCHSYYLPMLYKTELWCPSRLFLFYFPWLTVIAEILFFSNQPTFLVEDFLVGKKIQMPSFRDCLSERKTVQMLTISREVAIEVQSLVTVIGSLCIGNTICNSMILFQDLLVSTTLSPDDTTNLFTYAVLRLTPHALTSNTNSWSYLRKGTSAPNVAANSAVPNAGLASEGYQHRSRDTSPGGQSQRYHILRPLQRDKWSKRKDGFVGTDIWGAEVGTSIPLSPTLWLQQTEEHAYLCVYQYRNLTLILLIPVCLMTNGEQGLSLVKKQLLENASQKIVNVEEKLSRGWGGENAYHVSGYRYLLVDRDMGISRASPPGKVTTLTKDSLLALNKLREEVDLEKSRAKRDNPDYRKDFEVCIRARNNAWIIAKVTRGRELYMALEKANETLLYASDAVEKFSNRYCDGAFSLD
ncbi:vacuolar fusion protein CCZ1 homolog [Phoenix dactylifera]|uniref:Vacuolar fusion protein CCZ1 homolog n=1 Tax=Phoenix dactylifera TaxID=42345 RepID=A0A8B8ZNK8_PHODC|nr:vacuolar fusion protein CCZ1 homolog [Phoenix dactylifera]